MNAQRSGKLCFFVAVLRNSSILLPCSEWVTNCIGSGIPRTVVGGYDQAAAVESRRDGRGGIREIARTC